MHRGERCLRRAQPLPVRQRAPDDRAVPARRGAGRSRRGRAHRALGAARPLAGGARAQHSSRRATTSASTSARAAGAGHRGPPAPARRAALERRRQLHARARGRARDAAAPRTTRGACCVAAWGTRPSIARMTLDPCGLQGLRRPRHRPGRARRRRRVPHRPRLRGRVRAARDGDRPRHAADVAGAVRGRHPRRARRRQRRRRHRPRRHRDAVLTRSASTATRAA